MDIHDTKGALRAMSKLVGLLRVQPSPILPQDSYCQYRLGPGPKNSDQSFPTFSALVDVH